MTGPWAQAVRERLGVDDTPVEELDVREGVVAGRVDGCDVELTTELVPQRIWTAMWRFARGNGPLEAAAEGREQSDHLTLLLREDWDVELVPERIRRSCSCDGAGACGHVRALAAAFAAEIDAHPAALLRWRGCTPERARIVHEPELDEPVALPPGAWEAGELPPPRRPRPLPAGSVLKRLGPSGIRVGDVDLADALQPAYEAFAAEASSPQAAENVSPGASSSKPSPD